MSGLVLLGVYAVLVIVGEIIGLGISYEMGQRLGNAGEVIFMVLVLGMLIAPWPLAVFIQERFWPD